MYADAAIARGIIILIWIYIEIVPAKLLKLLKRIIIVNKFLNLKPFISSKYE